MSFGIGESQSTATDSRIAATDQAQVNKGGSASNSPFLKAKVNTGIANSKVSAFTGVQVKVGKVGKGAVVNVGDTTGAAAAAAVSDLSKTFADTVATTGKQDLTSQLLSTLSGLGQNATEQTLASKIQPTTINVGTDTGAAINGAISDAANKATQPAVLVASTGSSSGNTWLWILGAAIVAFLLYKKLR
jgi:hypothetical protein